MAGITTLRPTSMDGAGSGWYAFTAGPGQPAGQRPPVSTAHTLVDEVGFDQNDGAGWDPNLGAPSLIVFGFGTFTIPAGEYVSKVEGKTNAQVRPGNVNGEAVLTARILGLVGVTPTMVMVGSENSAVTTMFEPPHVPSWEYVPASPHISRITQSEIDSLQVDFLTALVQGGSFNVDAVYTVWLEVTTAPLPFKASMMV